MKLATTIEDVLYDGVVSDYAEAVRAYEGSGFRHLDFSFLAGGWLSEDDWMHSVIAAATEAERLGMDFVQAHAPGYNPMSPSYNDTYRLRFARAIEACGWLGVHNLVVHSGYDEAVRYPEGREQYFAANTAFYRELVPYMEKHRVRVLIENSCASNMGNKYWFMTGQEMADFIDAFGHPLLGACWDIGHGQAHGLRASEQFAALGQRLCALHVHDTPGRYDAHMMPFAGFVDWDDVLQGLQAIRYSGFFTFEAMHTLRLHRAGEHLQAPARLTLPSLPMMRRYLGLLYETGKYMLEQYSCFEE